MKAELLLGGTLKQYESASVNYDVLNLDDIYAEIKPPLLLPEFEDVSVERDGVEVEAGILDSQETRYGSDGSATILRGNDYRVKLLQYLTPATSIAGTTTVAALGTILYDSPIEVAVDGDFDYITEAKTWDTTLEFHRFDHSGSTVELSLGSTEFNQLVNAGTWTGCLAGLKSCFHYDGETKRYYIFVKNAAGDLYYYHSYDGSLWTGVDTTYNPSGDAWSVAWHDSKVYLFIYDGANTDFYRGTITDNTGVITFALVAGNIFTNTIRFGPVWDNQGDMWIVRNSGGGQAYESTDDGVNWNNRFGPGGTSLHGILPVGTDGDMFGYVLDAPNTDIEEWTWDRSAGTFTFTTKIRDEDAVDQFDACSDAAYGRYIVWIDTDDETWHGRCLAGGAWATLRLSDSGILERAPTISCDGWRTAYVSAVNNGGCWQKKVRGASLIETANITHTQPVYNSSPRTYLQDGEVAVFFTQVDSNTNDSYFILFGPQYIRLVEAAATGYFQTDSITASGSFVRWGWLVADGVELDDTEWSILKAADDTVLVDGQSVPFDLDVAGVPPTETNIKIRCDVTDTGTDPYVYEYTLSERVDEVYRDLDYENCLDAVNWLANLAEAETYVTYAGGTYTLHFVDERGSDKSGSVTLKTGYVSLYPDVPPNITAISRVLDMSGFANSVRVIGGIELNDRVDVYIQDWDDVNSRGEEYWAIIRDNDITTTGMGRTKAAVELSKRNSVTERIEVDFVDMNVANMVEVGDTVHLVAHFLDENLDVDGDYRIVSLRRGWGPDGESASASLVNRMGYTEFWNYMKKTDALERWATA